MVSALLLAALMAHPLHTTMTEVTVDPAQHTVRATVRVFADDLRGAVPETLVSGGVRLETADGKRLTTRGCGVRGTGNLLWICVEAAYAGSERDLRISNSLLCDRFPDQVNIVQVAVVGSGGRRSLLFTRGDGERLILR